jgi:hypothetical protein
MTHATETAAPVPSEKLKALERLVGTWQVSGGSEGSVTYRWMEGGFFMIQDVRLSSDGIETVGMEVIGHLRPFGGEQSQDVHSRYYDAHGDTLDYVYEMDGDTLTIWAGGKDSPAYFRGTFSADGNTNTGAWIFPGGGGYDSVMTRVS